MADLSQTIAILLASKDDAELNIIQLAASVTSEVYTKFVKAQLLDIIDDDRIVRHDKMSTDIESAIENEKYLQDGMSVDDVDACFPPIIQSGGKFNLRFSAQSEKTKIEFDTIVAILGIRYKYYCSSIIRTLMVNPNEEQKQLYGFVLSLHEMLCASLIPGARFCDIFQKIYNNVKQTYPNYTENFVRSLGFVTGLEFRENTMIIDSRNPSEVTDNMVIATIIGFQNIKSSESKSSFCVAVGETVVVQPGGAVMYTTAKRSIPSLCVHITDNRKNVADLINEEVIRKATNIVSNRKRQPQLDHAASEEQRKAHQAELKIKLNEEARLRLINEEGSVSKKPALFSANSSCYKSPAHIPNESDIVNLKIYIDKNTDTIILPVFGMCVPFHVSYVKSISTNSEGNFTYLRINFAVNISPGTKGEDLSTTYGKNVFLKEMIFRASSIKSPSEAFPRSAALLSLSNKIRDLQKSYKTRLLERTEMEGIVKQADLIINASKMIPRLRDVSIRPQLGARRLVGTLESHSNGFRYATSKGDHIDILYSNILHAIFQPPDNEILIIIHFHLKSPIMINKRKHKDIQFYTEVGEAVSDLGKATSNMLDRDEIEAEQSERETRNRLKSSFKMFIERVEASTDRAVEFQIPFRELGFLGVPNKTSVLLVPTPQCLINIVEQPPYIICLDDVELVHFERVGFNMKNFDMVIIFKDYHRKVSTISSIPMSYLEAIKEWLNSCDIKYNEGNQNLNWAKIMKTILDDPQEFFSSGGWSFLDMDSENDDNDVKVDDEGDEEYQPDESEEYASDESDSNSENYQSENSESGDGLDEGSESGKSWSELEEEARQMDALKHGEIYIPKMKRKQPPMQNHYGDPKRRF